jgi:phage terminase large subunit-like protein
VLDPNRWQTYAAAPAAFRADLVIDRDVTPCRLDDWQATDFAALDSGWLRCIGYDAKSMLIKQRAYLERPRGHSKTSDLAVMVTWAIVFAPRMVRGVAAAADRDQARLLRDAILRLVRLNPWLGKILDVQAYVVRNIAEGHPGRDSQLEIISSDAGSSFGLLVDFIVADEITNWQGDGELWHSLISAAAKRSSCLVVVISNAGRNQGDCWQWGVREYARESDGWYFCTIPGPVASWISENTLNEQKRILPPAVYKRLWLNLWVTGGDAFDPNDIDSAITMAGPMEGNEEGFRFVAGLDLSTKRDRSSLVVLGAKPESHRVRLARVWAWGAVDGGVVDLQAVRAAVLDAHKTYRRLEVHYDPFQAALMAMDLTEAGVKMEEMTFTGQNLTKMASAVLEAFRGKQIDLFDDKDLVRDLKRISIEEKSFGWKLTATRTKEGHADRGTALAIALPRASEIAGKKKRGFYVTTGDGSTDPVREPTPPSVYRGGSLSRFVRKATRGY